LDPRLFTTIHIETIFFRANMKLRILFIISLIYITICEGHEGWKRPSVESLTKEITLIYPRLSTAETRTLAMTMIKIQKENHILNKTQPLHVNDVHVPVPFTCPSLSPSPQNPTSVHQLRPGDIKVVAALGDSITAGLGAKSKNLLTILTQYRGVSWSIGGDETVATVLTLPNILKKYNPGVVGFSIGTGDQDSSNSKLNMAVSGAVASNLPGQADLFIAKLKSMPNVDIQNDWKVLTIWIGGNDLCEYCNDVNSYSPDNYANYLLTTLQKLKAGVPKLFVNLVLAIDVTKLYPLKTGGCILLHNYACPCGTSDSASVRASVSSAAAAYNSKITAMRDDPSLNDADDFTVVLQPFFVNTQIPLKNGSPDKSYFAPDCFHFSFLAHEAAAVALWNDMVEPVGSKRTQWTIGEDIECPSTQNPYLYTNQNSLAH